MLMDLSGIQETICAQPAPVMQGRSLVFQSSQPCVQQLPVVDPTVASLS